MCVGMRLGLVCVGQMQMFDKQCQNNDKCRFECREFIDKGRCDDWFIWNTSICECDKSFDVGEYLYYVNCKCRKRLIDKLVEKCDEEIDGNERIYKVTLSNYEGKCRSCSSYETL